jgi:hypothetical protein
MTQNIERTRAAIVAALQAVPGIGAVHDRERYASQAATLRALYVVQTETGEQLHGWYVRRLAFRVERNGAGMRRVFTTWQLRGFMALQDEAGSELAFDAVIDAVRAAFDADPTIGGAVQSTLFEREVGAQLTASGPVMFAGVLCHAADMTLTTETLE